MSKVIPFQKVTKPVPRCAKCDVLYDQLKLIRYAIVGATEKHGADSEETKHFLKALTVNLAVKCLRHENTRSMRIPELDGIGE